MNDIFKWLTVTGISPIAILGWITVGIVAWVNMRWRIKNLEDRNAEHENRHDKMEAIIAQQVELTRDVELNNRELKVICAVTERRLTLVEDRVK